MKEKELTLKEAEQIVDTMYENKFINSGTFEGNNIHLGNMDNIEFTDLENASIYLLREEIRLRQELQRKDNIINKLKKWLKEDVKVKPDLHFQVLRKIDILDKINELEGENK